VYYQGKEKSIRFMKDDQGVSWYEGRIYVSKVKELKDKIFQEDCETTYSIHPGRNKMYHDLKPTYWWYRIKGDAIEYVALRNTY
jgi:hypothetical protein